VLGWRRGWESNPRSLCGDTRFRGEPDRPLWHLSVKLSAGHIIISAALLTRVFGRVAELADAPDLGSGPERDGGSNPSAPTILRSPERSEGRAKDALRSSTPQDERRRATASYGW